LLQDASELLRCSWYVKQLPRNFWTAAKYLQSGIKEISNAVQNKKTSFYYVAKTHTFGGFGLFEILVIGIQLW